MMWENVRTLALPTAICKLTRFCFLSLALGLICPAGAQTVSTGPFPTRADPQTGYFTQTLTVGNATGTNFPGIRVLVRDLPPDTQVTNLVRVGNAHGVLNIGASTNIPYFDFGPINAGASVDFAVDFYISNRKIFPTPRYEVSVRDPGILILPVTLLVTNNATRFENGKFFAEFKTDNGRAYYVQYNTSLTATNSWKTSLPNVRGTGDKVLWVDDGPPRTESKPTEAGSRFYRVLLLPQ